MHRLVLALVLCLFALACHAGEGQHQSLRLLILGNSFTRNVLDQFPGLATSGGQRLEVVYCAIPGGRLEQHWQRHLLAEQDPSARGARYNNGLTLRAALDAGPWDVVTIQQYSYLSHDAASYRPHADRLVELIRQAAPAARVMLHQVWAYRRDDPRFDTTTRVHEDASNLAEAAGVATDEPRDPDDMHRRIAAACRAVAGDLRLGVIPTGDAFARIAADPVWGFVLDPAWDPAQAQPRMLPEQSLSLHAGWFWKEKDGKPVLAADGQWRPTLDGHHASPAGSYLAACVWYAMLFKQNPVGLTHRPAGMTQAHADALH